MDNQLFNKQLTRLLVELRALGASSSVVSHAPEVVTIVARRMITALGSLTAESFQGGEYQKWAQEVQMAVVQVDYSGFKTGEKFATTIKNLVWLLHDLYQGKFAAESDTAAALATARVTSGKLNSLLSSRR